MTSLWGIELWKHVGQTSKTNCCVCKFSENNRIRVRNSCLVWTAIGGLWGFDERCIVRGEWAVAWYARFGWLETRPSQEALQKSSWEVAKTWQISWALCCTSVHVLWQKPPHLPDVLQSSLGDQRTGSIMSPILRLGRYLYLLIAKK